MKRKLSTIAIAFPSNLTSTMRTPTSMSTNFAREIINMYALKNGAGSKRNGVLQIGNTIGASNVTIRKIMYYISTNGDLQILAYTDEGKIYLKSGDDWIEKYSGFNINGTIRWSHFAGKLIICNGLNDVISWDGTEFTPLSQWITDSGASLTYISTTSFSLQSDVSVYPVGRPLKMELGAGTEVSSTVASVSESAGVVTVIIADAVLTASLSSVQYEKKPPKFNYLYAAHNRLWGFGKGALLANKFSDNIERGVIYYTDKVEDETAWHDENGIAQFINLSDQMPLDDELVAMAVKDGLTVFFFKNNIQIWAGSDPTSSGDFTWNKTVPLGAIHGDLVVEMPNDIGFFTRFGARTLTRLLQTEQLDISDLGSEIDPTLSQEVTAILQSDEAYRNVFAFRFDKQGWFGFKMSAKSYVFQISGHATGWTVFDGIFENATALVNTPDGGLYIAVGNQLYIYNEGVYADNGATISTKWWTPWLSVSSSLNRWANKYTELIAEQGAQIKISMKRFKSYNNTNYVELIDYTNPPADYWDTATWDYALFDNGYPVPKAKRDHFIADIFAYSVESNSTEGPLTLLGMKYYGIQER